MTEDQLAKQVAEYLRIGYPNLLWFHTPNGGSRHVAEAVKLKSMGVLPGVADILLFKPAVEKVRGAICVHYLPRMLAIELKVGKNKQTPTQIELRRAGATAAEGMLCAIRLMK